LYPQLYFPRSKRLSHRRLSLTARGKLTAIKAMMPARNFAPRWRIEIENGPMGSHTGMGGVGLGIPGIGGIGGMGRPGGPGMGRGAGNEEQRTRLATLVAASEQLTIVEKGPEIDVTDSDHRERSLFTDGRKIEKSKKDASQVTVKARWEHGTLITKEKGPNGEKLSHAYEITGEGKQLADTLTLESKHLNTPIIVRSVYDKAGADQGE
jgi:hypothetical protein